MKTDRQQRRKRAAAAGFSLVELIITLTILALLAGLSVPAITGVVRENEAREPLVELAQMARLVRSRAMDLQRPYQIGLDEKGCYAAPYFQPYQQTNEFEELKREIESRQVEASLFAAAAQRYGSAAGTIEPDPDANFLERYEWPEGIRIQMRFWGDHEWEDLTGARFRRWVFQTSGISRPLMIRFENEGASIEARFNALTGEIEDESFVIR